MFFGFIHTLVMRKIKKSQKIFVSKKLITLRELSHLQIWKIKVMKMFLVGIRKILQQNGKEITAPQNWKWLNFSHLCHLRWLMFLYFFSKKNEKTKSPAHGAYCIPCVAWYVQDNFACSSPLAAFSQRGHLGGSHKFFHPTVGQTVQSVLTAR